ncbi:MAG: chromosome segregation protein Spc25-domain-containing protein [Monoraphidium minutum]|nr:MAG: chromosome segregation protein Spc25-domain-containing protein [Monoraphidium minutum]
MIDTDELQRELDKTQTAFKKWASATSKAAQEGKNTHTRNMRVASGEVESLNDRYIKLEKQAAEVQEYMSRDTAERDSLRGVAESLVGERTSLQRRLLQIRSELEAETREAEALDKELQQAKGEQSSRLGALDKVLRLYQSVLGLELVPGDDELNLVFTLIDPRDAARRFVFAVKVLEDNTYMVTSCEPRLETLGELSQLLRQENRFAEFVKAARKGFSALVQREIEDEEEREEAEAGARRDA